MDSTSPVRHYVKREVENIHTGFLATVITYDPTKLTLSIQPLLKRRRQGVVTAYPVLTDVPLVTPLGARNYIKPVYTEGDLVYCTVSEASLSAPLDKEVGLDSATSHGLENVLVIGGVGGTAYEQPAAAMEDGLVISGDNNHISLTEAGVKINTGVATDNLESAVQGEKLERELKKINNRLEALIGYFSGSMPGVGFGGAPVTAMDGGATLKASIAAGVISAVMGMPKATNTKIEEIKREKLKL